MRRSPLLATALLLVVTAIWGSTFVVVKDAIGRMPAMDFLVWRFGIATVVMAAVRPRALAGLNPAGLRRGILLGLALGAGYIFQTVGLETTPATVSAFVTGLFIVFTPLCAGVLLRQRISGLAWTAVALATLGLALITLHGWQVGTGELLTLGCALAFALQLIGLSEWADRHDTAALSVVQLAVTTVMALAGAAPSSLAPPPDGGVWGAVLLTALAATALAFFIQTWATTVLDSTRAAIVLTTEPVFAAIFGVAVGGDAFSVRTAVGALCVLGAMLLIELGPRRARDAAVERLEM